MQLLPSILYVFLISLSMFFGNAENAINSNQKDQLNEQLYTAACEGNLEKVQQAVSKGADIQSMKCDLALREAAANGDLPIVKFLVKGGATGAHAFGLEGNALLAAATQGHLEVVKFLSIELPEDKIAKLVGLNWKNLALAAAALLGHLSIVKFLLIELPEGQRADIHEYDDMALINAAKYGHLNVMKFLLEELPKGLCADIHAGNNKALREASFFGQVKAVELLLSKGANIHAKNDEALRLAIDENHWDLVFRLLDWGADQAQLNSDQEKKLKRYIFSQLNKEINSRDC